MKVEEENLYKYVLDVDANYPSGRFKRLMYVQFFPNPLRTFDEADFLIRLRVTGVRDLSCSNLLYSLNGGPSESCLYVVVEERNPLR